MLGAGNAGSARAVDHDLDLVETLARQLHAFSSAAPEMMAVPCWSSWKTGIFIVFFRVSSM